MNDGSRRFPVRLSPADAKVLHEVLEGRRPELLRLLTRLPVGITAEEAGRIVAEVGSELAEKEVCYEGISTRGKPLERIITALSGRWS